MANRAVQSLKLVGGVVDISPKIPAEMGCGPTRKLIKDTSGALECNYAIFSHDNSMAILLAFDLLYVGWELRARIEVALSPYFKPDQIFTFASHTHYAPMVDTTKPMMGLVRIEYVDEIVAALVESIIKSLNNG